MAEDRTTTRPTERLGSGAGPVLVGQVIGHALVRLMPGDLPAMRKRPGPVPEGWGRVPSSLLRYADEQTVAGVAAVFKAMADRGRTPGDFEGWGVVAASRYVGRASLAQALRTFEKEGVWGTSPHLIPHFALHSPSGTISLALGLHGPNLGVGGGLHASAEGFLAALTWLAGGVVPGAWLILSGWSPELVPDRSGGAPRAGECRALALALAPEGSPGGSMAVRVVVGDEGMAAPAPVDLVGLAAGLARPEGPMSRTIATDPRGYTRVELVWP